MMREDSRPLPGEAFMKSDDKSVHGERRAGFLTWLTVSILVSLFVAAVWFSIVAWESVPNLMTTDGFVAMALGIVFSIVVGVGLMGLLFWSHRKGYDR